MRCIEYKIPKEKLISRIPALFSYIDFDDNGTSNKHKATDSECGCYGKIVENIRVNCDFYVPVCVKRKIDANAPFVGYDGFKYQSDGETEEKILIIEQVLKSGHVYSYRTLIDYYNKYKDKKIFVDINNNLSSYILINSEGFVQDLKDWDGNTIISGEYKCSESKFYKFIEGGIGKVQNSLFGDKRYPLTPKYLYAASARNLYNELIKLKKICAFYKANKENIDFDNSLCCDCEKYEQMGGDAFVSILQGLIQQSETKASEYNGYSVGGLALEFEISLFGSSNDLGLVSCPIKKWEPFKRYFKEDKVFYNGLVWSCTGETTGKYIEETETVIFDTDNFEVYNPDFISDGRIDGFVGQRRGFYETNPLDKIDAVTKSKLKSLRRTTVFENKYGEAEMPQEDYDWLFYYRQNKVMTPPRVITNNVGNICKLENDSTYGIQITDESASDGEELAAYGDYIESIVVDSDNFMITFTYYIDAHLKATLAGTEYDDDKNLIYKWKDFKVDKSSQFFKKFGIKYVETYTYEEDSDLDKLIKGQFTLGGKTFNFNDYINGKYDNFKGVSNQVRFEFTTINTTKFYEKKIHFVDKTIKDIVSDYEIDRKDVDNLVYADIKEKYGKVIPESSLPWGGTKNLYDVVKFDYYNGISYEPSKKIDVNIQRGNTALFEKHIKLGEVKTLEDMEQYQNSSFFPMNET